MSKTTTALRFVGLAFALAILTLGVWLAYSTRVTLQEKIETAKDNSIEEETASAESSGPSVSITYLTDNSCESCYDVKLHRSVLERSFGLTISSEQTFDRSEEDGQRLIEMYGLEAIPTVLLSKEAAAYPELVTVWRQVGDVALDGAFIFRDMTSLGGATYVDLKTGQQVNPSTE